MNKIVRALVFFVLTLFWGLISLHTVPGIWGAIITALGTGITAESTMLVEKALKVGITKEDWKFSLYAVLGIVVSIIVIFTIYSSENY